MWDFRFCFPCSHSITYIDIMTTLNIPNTSSRLASAFLLLVGGIKTKHVCWGEKEIYFLSPFVSRQEFPFEKKLFSCKLSKLFIAPNSFVSLLLSLCFPISNDFKQSSSYTLMESTIRNNYLERKCCIASCCYVWDRFAYQVTTGRSLATGLDSSWEEF